MADERNLFVNQFLNGTSSSSSYCSERHPVSLNTAAPCMRIKEKEPSMDGCSPRVRNLQSEMDLLRTEIQRLKSIDIYTYPNCQDADRCSLPSERRKQPPSMSREEKNMKLMQMGLASYKQISDSDASEPETSGAVDFETLIQQLKSENKNEGLQSSMNLSTAGIPDAGSDVSSADRWENRSHVFTSRGTDPVALECAECTNLRQERFRLVHEIHQTEAALQQQIQRVNEAEEETKSYACDLQELKRRQSDVSHVGVTTEDLERRAENDRQFTTQSTQCKMDRAYMQKLECEAKEQKKALEELQASNAILLNEKEAVRKSQERNEEQCFMDEERCREMLELRMEASRDEDSHSRLVALLSSTDLQSAWIPSLTSEIHKLFHAAENIFSEKQHLLHRQQILKEENKQLHAALQHLEQQKDAAAFNLNAEKDVLTHKVMELRQIVKQETSEKEAAQDEATKLQNDIRDHFSEMEQSRIMVQQKRTQINELEDSMAVLQHENEKWERDYGILLRKKEQTERELRVARKLEDTLTTDAS